MIIRNLEEWHFTSEKILRENIKNIYVAIGVSAERLGLDEHIVYILDGQKLNLLLDLMEDPTKFPIEIEGKFGKYTVDGISQIGVY